jgi:hypothetical protein
MVSPVHGDHRRCQADIPLIVLCRFPEPVLRTGRKLTSIIMLRAAIPPAARFGNAPRIIGSGNLVALK